LFSKFGASNTLSTLVRSSEEGATDARVLQSERLLAEAVERQVVYDDILQGFVSDPAIFAATVSHMATARLTPSKLEEVREAKTIKALRKLAAGMSEDLVVTESTTLQSFLTGAVALGADGRAWVLLVAAHLSTLKADTKLRPLLFLNTKAKEAQ
jgi:hypothetical protein